MFKFNKNNIDISESAAKVNPNDVGELARRGVKWSSLQIIGRNVLSLGVTAILARLLSPEDYGLIGMVTTLTAFLLVFSDMGLSTATIQRKNLSKIQISNLFWINILVGIFFWLVCILIAPSIADFYNQQELIGIAFYLGSGFLFSGISAQPMALLNRKMNFEVLAKIEIFALIFGAILGIVAAINNLGYWSLVIQSISIQAFRAFISFPASNIKILRPIKDSATKDLVNFGALIVINGMLIFFARNLDSVFIGKYWGAEELGYYNRAYFLMLLPSMIATGVLSKLLIPSLAVFQDDIKRFGNAYRRSLRMVSFFGCPLALGMILVANELVIFIYGDQWYPVVPILVWLGIASVTQPIYNTTGWLFTAMGKAKEYLYLTVLNAIILTIAFIAAIPYGAIGMAIAYGITMGVIIFLPAMWFSHRVVEINLVDSIRYIYPVFLSLAFMCFFVLIADYIASILEIYWILELIIKVLIGIITYTFAAYFIMKQFILNDLLPIFIKNKKL